MNDDIVRSIDQYTKTTLFKKIGDICATVNAVTNARDLLELSLRKTMDLFGAERGSIFILNDSELILKIGIGLAGAEEDNMVKRLGEGVVGRVAASKKPIFVDDISQDERFENYQSRKSYRTPSFICAPLLIKDTLVGVINIADKGCGSRFSPNELQILDFLSSQIALNYRRIQLYLKFKTVVKESRSLKDELGKSSQETKHLKKQIVLQEKLASIGKLAGGIAHEFNNPLDGVMRYTNLCLEQIKDNEVVHGYLLEIKHGLNRMANIVRSLLACSRNPAPSMRKIDPNFSIDQVVNSFQTDIVHKNITLKKNLQSDLPELIDLGLERAISNLVRNAIDAVDTGGSLEITSLEENEHIVIEVKDNGCGIFEIIQGEGSVEKIFEPFYTTKDIEKGCGLGLTIVSEIVKSYNGQINVESSSEEGTTFTISIPINFNGSINNG